MIESLEGVGSGCNRLVRAAFVAGPGPAESIRWDVLPDPARGPDQVLVRTRAVAVDHVDTYVRSGSFHTPVTWPLVVGRDLVGEVLEPPEHGGLAQGDLVWTSSLGYENRPGATGELAVIEEARCYRLPDGVDPVEAVATFHGATTALLGLRRCGLAPGEHLFVHGGGGGVGAVVVQVGLDAGARITATARDDETLAWLRDLRDGVRMIDAVDSRERPQADLARDVDVHWDSTGRIPLGEALVSLARRGRVVVTARRDTDEVPLGDLYLSDQSIIGFVLSRATCDELAWAAAETNRLLAEGMRARAVRTMTMDQAARAHALLEAGEVHGKLVLVPPTARPVS